MNWEIITFIAYFAILLGVALVFYFNGTNKNSEDFFLGGRSMGPWVTALSAQASDMSAWLLMGLPGSILAFGFGQMWIGIGLALGTAANWILCAKRLRTFSKAADDAITLPQYLTNRFATDSRSLQLTCALIFLFAYTIYVASALVAGTSVFTTLFPTVSPKIAMFAFLLIIVAYTFFGGFTAVCWTDFFQGLLMLIAILAVPVLTWGFVGGDFHNMLANTGVNPDNYLSFTYNGDRPITAVEIISNMAWGLGYCGMPHILIRFMAIRSEKELKKSSAIAIVWVVLSLGFTIAIGLLGRAFLYPEILGVTEGAPSAESVFIEMIQKIFIEKTPIPFIAGLFICGILAAVMSTADSQLLVCSSSVSKDIYQNILNPEASDKKVLNVARLTTFGVAVVAFFIAWDPNSSIMDLVSDAWAGLGAAFGPLVVMSLFWRRTNLPGAVAGLVSGAATVLIWDYLPIVNGQTIGNATGIYSLLVGFVISLCFIVIVSMVTKAPDETILAQFDEYKKYEEKDM